MRTKTMLMLVSLPLAAALADGNPKSLAPLPPPPEAVMAPPPPPPVEVAPLPQFEPPAPVARERPAPPEVARGGGFGSDTRYWVDTQISGSQASTEARPVAGDVAKRNYDRYLKSFEYPIPETYKRENFANGGGSGGSTR